MARLNAKGAKQETSNANFISSTFVLKKPEEQVEESISMQMILN